MGLDSLWATHAAGRLTVTSVTAGGDEALQLKPLPPLTCTVVTSVTDKNNKGRSETTMGRKWVAGWPFTCQCGTLTGWATDGMGICPSCAAGGPGP